MTAAQEIDSSSPERRTWRRKGQGMDEGEEEVER